LDTPILPFAGGGPESLPIVWGFLIADFTGAGAFVNGVDGRLIPDLTGGFCAFAGEGGGLVMGDLEGVGGVGRLSPPLAGLVGLAAAMGGLVTCDFEGDGGEGRLSPASTGGAGALDSLPGVPASWAALNGVRFTPGAFFAGDGAPLLFAADLKGDGFFTLNVINSNSWMCVPSRTHSGKFFWMMS